MRDQIRPFDLYEHLDRTRGWGCYTLPWLSSPQARAAMRRQAETYLFTEHRRELIGGHWLMATAIGFLLLLSVVGLVFAVIAMPIWLIHNYMTDTLWHDFNCVCQRCKDKIVSDEVKRREKDRFRDETRRAVDEMMRASHGRS